MPSRRSASPQACSRRGIRCSRCGYCWRDCSWLPRDSIVCAGDYNGHEGDAAMPMHDWTRVRSGTYHNFHQGWTIQLRDGLNGGILPSGYFAEADRSVLGSEPDVTTYQG